MRIGIIGLGLIGGSMAMALRASRGAEDETVWAVDSDEAVRADALDARVVDDAYGDLDSAPVEDADLLILCLHPEACLRALRSVAARMRPGAVVTDVCGIKRPVMACAAKVVPAGIAFIGGHPMAGKERGGFANASPTLFHRAHYLLTPPEGAPAEAIDLLRRMALRLGCADVVVTTPETHDANIAYTSQMMHVLALAICEQTPFDGCGGFEGGSFRGATRVAALDTALWAELFWENRDALAEVTAELAGKLTEYAALLRGGDRDALTLRLREASSRKEAWNHAHRAGSS